MRIGIYHPNLHLYGGGEYVALSIAQAIAQFSDVDFLTPTQVNLGALGDFFGFKLSARRLVILGNGKPFNPTSASDTLELLRSSYELLASYDVIVDSCSGGWFDQKLPGKTICYIHFPVFDFGPGLIPQESGGGIVSEKSPLNFGGELQWPRVGLRPMQGLKYDVLVCNSNFTRDFTKHLTDKEIAVVPPPVDAGNETSVARLPRIVTVGRLSRDKQIDVMISAFSELCKTVSGWEFHIVGVFRNDSGMYEETYLQYLMKRAEGLPIKFHVNMPHTQLLEFLSTATIYWHARGFGSYDPRAFESFGITTAEAMGRGCLPIVVNLGAQPEIVTHGRNGFCWNTVEELISYTKGVIGGKYLGLAQEAKQTVKKYSRQIFESRMRELVGV